MIDFLLPHIDFSGLMLQLANNLTASGLAAPPLPADNIIATTGQVEQVADQTTNTLIGTASAIGAAITGVFAKNRYDNKKNEKSIRNTDMDLVDYMELLALEVNYTLENPNLSRADILKLRAYPGEPAITTTLAEAQAKELKEWKEFIKAKYYTNPA